MNNRTGFFALLAALLSPSQNAKVAKRRISLAPAVHSMPHFRNRPQAGWRQIQSHRRHHEIQRRQRRNA